MATGSANRLNQRETTLALAIPDLLVHLVNFVSERSQTPRVCRRNERMRMTTSQKGNATVARTVVSFASPTSPRVTIRPARASRAGRHYLNVIDNTESRPVTHESSG